MHKDPCNTQKERENPPKKHIRASSTKVKDGSTFDFSKVEQVTPLQHISNISMLKLWSYSLPFTLNPGRTRGCLTSHQQNFNNFNFINKHYWLHMLLNQYESQLRRRWGRTTRWSSDVANHWRWLEVFQSAPPAPQKQRRPVFVFLNFTSEARLVHSHKPEVGSSGVQILRYCT